MTGNRVLVVDDDPSVTSLLRRGLTYEGFVVRTAESGEEALRVALTEPPDLVVLDIMMRGLSGVEVCRRMSEADPDLPIVMLTARDSPEDEIAGLEAGADDYVTKPFSFEVLVARIRSLLRRRGPEAVDVLRYADLTLDMRGRAARRGSRFIELTTTEFDLLALLVGHAEQVLTKEQILEQVWGYDFGGSVNIVEVYVRSLRLKLEAEGEPRLVQTIRGAGYVVRR